MTNSELILFMALAPIIYFLIFTRMDRKIIVPGKRISTICDRRGEVLTVTPTHSFINLDDGRQEWYRNEMFTAEFTTTED